MGPVRLLSVLVTLSIVSLSSAAAGDVEAGKKKARTCVMCHGNDFKGKAAFPPIADIEKDRFAQTIKDFASGAKPSTVMRGYASKLNDEDIADIAAYLASLKK